MVTLRWRFILLAWLAAGAGLVPPACGFVMNQNSSGKILHWNLTNFNNSIPTNVVNRQTRAVRYFVGADAFSQAGHDQEINAIRSSFDQWQAVPGTILRFEYGGTIGPLTDINTSDKTNTIFWKKGGTSLLVNGELDDITGRHAITYNIVTTADNFQREADIVLNGVEENWFTDYADTANRGTFVEAILLHEIGHFVGLEHSPVGGASLFVRTLSGLSAAAGLAGDEITAARFLYPDPGFFAGLGAVRGRITLNGDPVLGAMVFAENAAGNTVAGTVTRAGGQYFLQALAPGSYSIRVSPLDPAGTPAPLVSGIDIADLYAPAETRFRPATATSVLVAADTTNVVNFTVEPERPPFHIGYIRWPSSNPSQITAVNAPVTIPRGANQWWIGVFSPDLPMGATLDVTGDGVVVGPSTYNFKILSDLNLISAPVTVSAEASPGLRTLIVERGNDRAYASGFLEILPDQPDANFDGLDDRFQRKYFPLFTAPEAAPLADPDQDQYSNQQEYIAGTNPADSASLLKIERVTRDQNGTSLVWQSGPGRRYQVLVRSDSIGAPWVPLGSPVTAAGLQTSFLDPSPDPAQRFYRIQALP